MASDDRRETDVQPRIRRFNSEEHLATFREAYYGSDEWKNELLPRVKEMLDLPRMVVTRLEATPKSGIR
jgi:hypothetical protein